MGDYNIAQWVEKIFTEDELLTVLDVYNEHTNSNVTLALAPFISHEALKTVFAETVNRIRQGQFSITSEEVRTIERIADKLDEDQYWLDMTTIGSNYRTEYNTVTEEVKHIDRRYDDDYEIFRNVRSTL